MSCRFQFPLGRVAGPVVCSGRAVASTALVAAGLCLVWAASACCSESADSSWRPEELPVGRMAVVSDVTGKNEVWVIDKGGAIRQVTNAAAIPPVTVWDTGGHRRQDGTWEKQKFRRESYASITDPALSPDGEWVAYSMLNPHHHATEIWVVRADGEGEPAMLTTGHSDTTPAWFPDSRRIAFTRLRRFDDSTSDDIYVVDREKKGPARLLARLGDDWSIIRMGCSPDGKSIILERFGPVPPEGGLTYRFRSIWKLEVESGNVMKLPLKGESFSRPAWFPDGSAIIYCTVKKHGDPMELCKCKPDGSGEERLFSDPIYPPTDPTVSPDGQYVAFVRFRLMQLHRMIYLLEISTCELHALTPERGRSWGYPSWGPLPAQPEEKQEQ